MTVGAGRTVYGLRVSGLDDVAELAAPTDGSTAGIRVHVTQTTDPAPALSPATRNRSISRLTDGRFLDLRRSPGLATFYGPHLAADQLAHPYLGAVALTFNRWAGREVFHAGAFVLNGRAWVLIGPRTAGKSTLTAALAGSGVPILADDIVVIDGTMVFAGPRSIDLRQAIPEFAMEGGRTTSSPARLGTRSRVSLDPIASSFPLGGWFFLHWADRRAMERIPIPALLGRLSAARGFRGLTSDPVQMLNLASRPAWDMRRRKLWSDLPATVDMLRAATSADSVRSILAEAVG